MNVEESKNIEKRDREREDKNRVENDIINKREEQEIYLKRTLIEMGEYLHINSHTKRLTDRLTS